MKNKKPRKGKVKLAPRKLDDQPNPSTVPSVIPSGNKFYKNIIESIEDYCVFTTDKKGIINSWSSGAEKILGYTEKEIIGKRMEILYTAADRKAEKPGQELRIAKARGRATNERWHIRKDKSLFWGSGLVFPLKDEQERWLGFTKVMRDLTERKKWEVQLMESESFSKNILNSSPDCVKIIDLDANLVSMNEPGKKLLEIDDFSKFEGKCWVNFWRDDDIKKVKSAIEKARKGKVGNFEAQADTAMGTSKWWDVTVSPIYDLHGKIKQFLSVSREITLRKKAEEERKELIQQLENEKNKLVSIFEHTPGFLTFLQGRDFVFERANKAYSQLIGHRDIIGKPLVKALPDIKDQGFIGLLNEVYKTGKPYYGSELKVNFQRKPKGKVEERYINLVYTPMKDVGGQIAGIIASGFDVTEQVESRKQAEISERRFRNLIIDAPMPMSLYTGIDMVISLANDAMIKLWGKDHSVIGKKLKDAVPELKGQPFLGLLKKVYVTGITYQTDEMKADLVVNGKLQEFWFNFSYKPILNADGKVYAILNTAIDITSQVEAKRQLKETEESRRFAIESGELGTWDFDIKTGMFKCDKRCQELYGLSNAGLVSHADSMKHIHFEDRHLVDGAIKNALISGPGGGKYDAEFRTISKDGKDVRWIRSKGQAYFNERKKPYRFSGTVMDITVQKQLQQQKDNFLGIASHELKTPVTSIKAYAQVLESIFRNRGDVKEAGMLSKLNAQVNRLTSLIADLLDVTKIQSGRLEFDETFFDFGQLVREVIDDMRPTAPKHQIVEEIAAIEQVYGDRERIRQVIINLITNAVKYSPHSDKIIVRAYMHKKNAILCVRDFGVGIANEKQGKVFEQFYRVSGDKQHTFPGLGLGLYISSEIVKRMDGKIWVESEEGKGSTFCFSLSLERGKTLSK